VFERAELCFLRGRKADVRQRRRRETLNPRTKNDDKSERRRQKLRRTDRRLGHRHGLEAALERGVLLDVLAVLVDRGRADALQLPARERRLEDVGRVDGALGRAGADERVDLVDPVVVFCLLLLFW